MTLVLCLLVFPAIGVLLVYAFTGTKPDGSLTGFTWDNFQTILTQGRALTAAVNSIVFAALCTAFAIVLGGTLAWLVERTDAPLRSLSYVTSVISMGTPYVLYVTAWVFLFGRAGPFNQMLSLIFGDLYRPIGINSMFGMVFVGSLLWMPLTFLLLSATFQAANADMEEAARISGASIFQTVKKITFPLAWPAILALAIFIFIRSLEAFEVPALIGMPAGINVLTTDIYQAMREVPARAGYPSAFSLLLLLLVSVLLFFYSRLSRAAERYASVTGKGFRPRPFKLGRGRWIAGAFIVTIFVVTNVLPLLALLWMALTPFVGSISARTLSVISLKNFYSVFNTEGYYELVVNTLIIAAASATVVMCLALIVGWLAVRRRPLGLVVDQLATLPLVFPGIVLGVAVLQIGLASPLPVYGTLWLIILAFTIGYLPHGTRYAYSGVIQIHGELEEASFVAGGGTFATISRIVVPLASPALASGWLFVFLVCCREITIPILLAGSHSRTISVGMLSLWSVGLAGEVAALGLLWIAFMSLVAGVFYLILRRQQADAFKK
ncbi:iron ABC transporter permease [Rhizobiales bacterium L72]|uniref:Iron ABC transporter permease n=2 Tax=Propylenella binzhouense TaxID=2555902 RepID=A0A964T2D5_9HYPH|nr:iron ABC transporter permease [Propylenella binzhouense]